MSGYVVQITPTIKHLGEGSFTGVIDSYFDAEVYVGNYTSIASPLYVYGAVEHPCVFNPQFVATFPFGDKDWSKDYPKAQSKGKIEIGSDCWIGAYVHILSGVKIGDGAIVGACSVLAKDVPPYAVVVGNPARIIKYRFTQDQIEKLLKIRWWNWSKERITESLEWMKNVDEFIYKYYDQ